MSILELDKTMPVRPPITNRKIKPFAQSRGTLIALNRLAPYKLANQLKTFTPVGTAIVIVAALK